ncbi:N-acetylmuramoyl-L-alanine amidase [Marinicella sp. S1101]|uniref:N-acetylmuramoyl-L-alanine amidase n=1 Tax=Marinicella marina TaxID=2996016 RepID=UPI002260AA68|nr:N-acetylmuramoyl-L-alanine amidase [Marinicella marina]MCX7555133.1 N-acetylmuramoyl-L-alanine amidase [Marinicella marina]MDJ1140342.1 N-acetylmuramoyl-L-alanine amidase [Marinicella marina]
MKKSILTALVLLFCSQVLATNIEGMRVWTGPDHTRAVFDLSEQADYKLFELQNPPRVVIDLDDSKLTSSLAIKNNKDIKKVRFSTDKNRVRIVLDLQDDLKSKSFLLKPTGKYGHRLVVDLRNEVKAPIKTLAEVTKPNRDVIVAIDAGHGGEDPGAIGPSGVYEKHVVLNIANELAKKIDAQKGMQAFVVRTGDYYLKHRKRFEKARQKGADLFVSIHADAFHSPKVNGASVYILNQRGASSEAAKWLAASENKSDQIGGVVIEDKKDVLSQVLYDLSQNAALEESHKAAKAVKASLKHEIKLHGQGFGQANFLVLKSPDVPSMLVETGYISNPGDERKLQDPKHVDKLTRQITQGIRNYFYQSPPPNTWIAAQAGNRKAQKHIVQTGDTLSEIATRNGISMSELKSINNKSSNRLMVGEVLYLPN